MSSDLQSLSVTACVVGFVHCVSGPDHYLPFLAMSRVGLWSLRKTLCVTLLCAVGHVAGSALLGLLGVAMGLVLRRLEVWEAWRGQLAGAMLAASGAGYLLWAVWRARRRRQSKDPVPPRHAHSAAAMTPWVLFVIFVFGPCEPLIPILMYPAAAGGLWDVVWIASVFGVTTVLTMLVLVTALYLGAASWPRYDTGVYGHVLAGAVVLACGLAVLGGA